MREDWVDNVKGIAILLVVIGHVIDGFELNGIYESAEYAWNIFEMIYSFHMPLFFWISGYLYRKVYLNKDYRIKDINKYRIHILNLLYIYVLFSVTKIFLKLFWPYSLIKTVTGRDALLVFIKPVVPYWYLWVIIFLYIITPYAINKVGIKCITMLVFALSFLSYLHLPKTIAEYGFSYAAMYSFFFVLGILKKRTENLNIYRFSIETILFILCVGCAFSRYIFIPIALRKLVKLVCAIVCSDYLVNAFSIYFDRSCWLGVLGQHSMEIYTIHMFITRSIGVLLKLLRIKTYFGGAIITTLLGVLIPIAFGVISKKVKLFRDKTLFDLIYCPFKYRLFVTKE